MQDVLLKCIVNTIHWDKTNFTHFNPNLTRVKLVKPQFNPGSTHRAGLNQFKLS